MAGELWGLWLFCLIRGADRDVPAAALSGLGEIGDDIRSAVTVIGSSFIAVERRCVFHGGSSDKAIRAAAHRCRCREPGDGRMPAVHELSYQKEGRHGAGRGSVPSAIIVPPQHGQRSNAIPAISR